MLLTADPRERVIQRGQDVVGCFGRLLSFEERGLGEDEALDSLVCDSAGAEATIEKMFAGNDLSRKHAAPKSDG